MSDKPWKDTPWNDKRTGAEIQADTIRRLNRDAELRAALHGSEAGPQPPTAELSELKQKVTTMRIAAQERIRDDAWRWPHVQPNVLESVIGAIGEISVVEAREALARLESEAAPPERVSEGKEWTGLMAGFAPADPKPFLTTTTNSGDVGGPTAENQ